MRGSRSFLRRYFLSLSPRFISIRSHSRGLRKKLIGDMECYNKIEVLLPHSLLIESNMQIVWFVTVSKSSNAVFFPFIRWARNLRENCTKKKKPKSELGKRKSKCFELTAEKKRVSNTLNSCQQLAHLSRWQNTLKRLLLT